MFKPTEEEKLALGLIGCTIILASVAFMLLWNLVISTLFGLGRMGFLEPLALMILINLMAPGAWAKVYAKAMKAAKEMSKE